MNGYFQQLKLPLPSLFLLSNLKTYPILFIYLFVYLGIFFNIDNFCQYLYHKKHKLWDGEMAQQWRALTVLKGSIPSTYKGLLTVEYDLSGLCEHLYTRVYTYTHTNK